MNNVTLVEKGRSTVYTGPAGWDELTPDQYTQYGRATEQHGDSITARFALLQIWYGLNTRTLHRLSEEQRADLLDLLGFLDTRPSRWMLPKLNGVIGQWDWRGPGDGLEHLTFGEFMYAEAALTAFVDSGKSQHAARLTAALYRPFDRNGDGERAPFAARLLDQQTERAMRLERAVLTGVAMNYMGCKDQFPAEYPSLFSRSATKSDGSGGWMEVGVSLARQTGAMGTFAELERTNLYLALTTLDQILKEQQEMAERMKKHGHG